jgi:hypothetical protein
MADQNSNALVLSRQFEAIKPASLANFSVYRHVPTANLIKTFKVSGYELQVMYIGATKITVAVLSYSRKESKTQPAVFTEINDQIDIILDSSNPSRKVWVSDYPAFNQAMVSKTVQLTQKLITTLPVGILVSRGIIDQSQAEQVLSDAVMVAYDLSDENYNLAQQFASYYFMFAAKYPSYSAVVPSKISAHLEHSELKALSASQDPSASF